MKRSFHVGSLAILIVCELLGTELAARSDCNSRQALERLLPPGPGLYKTGTLREVRREARLRIHRIPKMSVDSPRWNEVEETILKASEAFLRRGWPPEFMAKRLQIARDFAERSEYAIVQVKDAVDGWQTRGTIGLTWAEYGPGRTGQLLPMEEKYGWRIRRPGESEGKSGVVFEARTYSMDEGFHQEVYPRLMSELTDMMSRHLSALPGLAHEPIVATYGDQVSVRMYSGLGFRVMDEVFAPVKDEGILWHALLGSPVDVQEATRNRMATPYWVSYPGPSPVQIPSSGVDEALLVDPQEILFWKRNQILDATLARDQEVQRNLLVARGGRVRYNLKGQLQYVSKLAQTVELEPGIWAAEGSEVLWADGRHLTSVVLGRAIERDGIHLPEKSQLWFDYDLGQRLQHWVARLSADTRLPNGLSLPAGAEIVRISGGGIAVTGLPRELEISPGVWAGPRSYALFLPGPDGQLRLTSLTFPWRSIAKPKK